MSFAEQIFKTRQNQWRMQFMFLQYIVPRTWLFSCIEMMKRLINFSTKFFKKVSLLELTLNN